MGREEREREIRGLNDAMLPSRIYTTHKLPRDQQRAIHNAYNRMGGRRKKEKRSFACVLLLVFWSPYTSCMHNEYHFLCN